ncbi:glycosyltransferase family 4 protein [Cohnella sp. GCM10027633]|uniref:glycosyltransferase family 4 protein n=1 Tax=unclassified Cohnella TaxID=2636738 RepID=UPI003633D2EB
MKIVVICHYFYPEIGAPSARLFEMAKRWVDQGHEVQVVTCFPNHPTGIIPENYRGNRYMAEVVEGIKIHRNYVYATPNEGFFKKTLGHVSFMISSICLSLFRISKPDVIIVSSPTLFSVISGYIFSLFKRKPYIFEVRDLWPDAIIKLGVLKNKMIIKTLTVMEMFLYKRSKKVVVVTNSFKEDLVSRGVPPGKVDVITNGVDTTIFNRDDMPAVEPLRQEFGWGDKKVLLYVGAHGISQGLGTIIEAAKEMLNDSDVLFVFVGEGAEKKKLIDLAAGYGLSNVQFISPQDKHRIPLFYKASYLSFVPLRNLPMFDAYIPSKMFEILGSGCPIVASISGESAEILERSGGALVVEPENVSAIVQSVRKLLSDSELREKLSHQGSEFVNGHYSRMALADKYIGIMKEVTEVNSR